MVEEPEARPPVPVRGAAPTRSTPASARVPESAPAAASTTGDESFGWAGRVMVVLRFATQVVALNLLILVGTLAGGVLLGLFPALGSAGTLLARLAARDPSDRLWSDFWSGWRSGFGRLNRLGWPLWVVGVLLVADASVLAAADGPVAVALRAALALLTAYLVVVGAFLLAAARRYDETAARTWRFVALAPLLAPATALGVVVTVASIALACVELTVLIPLIGVALPLAATGWLADHRLDVIDAR